MMRKLLVLCSAVAILIAMGFAAYGYWQYLNTPFFQTRGLVLWWNDVKEPERLDWLSLAKKSHINTLSIFAHRQERETPEYKAFLQACADAGIKTEYQEHATSALLPRSLFAEHPEYFRQNEQGERVADSNCCPSSAEALEIIAENARKLSERDVPTNHRYYYWLDDGGKRCHCDKCKHLNDSDQALILENRIIKVLREKDPEALLAHLCYDNTLEAPATIKPEEGVFLEFAPFYRRWDKPLREGEAVRDGQTLTHGRYMEVLKENLAVFPVETAQVLEYWCDVSLVSGWSKPAKKLPWHKDVFLQDIDTYADLGIRHITAYAMYTDGEYYEMYGDVSFVEDYGNGLFRYRKE